MPLLDLEIDIPDHPLPARIVELIEEAHRRIDAFLIRQKATPIHGFVGSDYELAFATLKEIRAVQVATGSRFLEWGSGFGVVASIAGLLGYDACGVEVEADLIEEAQRLAADFGAPVQYAQGSMIPEGGDAELDEFGDLQWLVTDVENAYEELELDPEDFDVIYAYPWPGEEEVIEQLFLRCAAVGAILVSFHGAGDMRVRRKTRRRS